MSPLLGIEYLLDRSRVSWLGAQLISTCSVTGVAVGAGGSGAKSRYPIETPMTDPFIPTPIPRLVILPFPSLPGVELKSCDSSTTTGDDPLSAGADSELLLWLLPDEDLWPLLESCPLWLLLLCEEELLFRALEERDPGGGGWRLSGDRERYGL